MARDYVLIFVPEFIGKAGISKYVLNLFLPFGREYEFPDFIRPCECNGVEERVNFANKSTKHFHQFWRTYSNLSPESRPEWKDYIHEWEIALLSNQPGFPVQELNCDVCNGKGFLSTNNYPLNIYDYWVGMKEEYVGLVPQVKAEWTIIDLPNGKQAKLFQIVPPQDKPFIFYYVITPDGTPYKRWGYPHTQEWYDLWEKLAQEYQNYFLIRCLAHV